MNYIDLVMTKLLPAFSMYDNQFYQNVLTDNQYHSIALTYFGSAGRVLYFSQMLFIDLI